MAAPTFTITGLVLRRTKLAESDVIVTILAEDGSQHRAVAKGARKPTSTFASRLELFSVATILLAKGRNLDIVKEVRLMEGNAPIRSDLFRSSAASPLVELLAKATFQEQPTPRLFNLATAVLATIAHTDEDPLAPAIAGLLKSLAFLGFKPTFAECIDCASPIDLTGRTRIPFSYFDGGALCSSCASEHESTPLDAAMLRWAQALLYSTLDQIATYRIDTGTLQDLLVFTNEWIRVHLGLNMRSISFIFKNLPSVSLTHRSQR